MVVSMSNSLPPINPNLVNTPSVPVVPPLPSSPMVPAADLRTAEQRAEALIKSMDKGQGVTVKKGAAALKLKIGGGLLGLMLLQYYLSQLGW